MTTSPQPGREPDPHDVSGRSEATPPPPVRTKPYKAYGAFAVAFVVLLGQSLDPAADKHPVTATEWIVTVLGALATAYTTWQITNPAVNRNRGNRPGRRGPDYPNTPGRTA